MPRLNDDEPMMASIRRAFVRRGGGPEGLVNVVRALDACAAFERSLCDHDDVCPSEGSTAATIEVKDGLFRVPQLVPGPAFVQALEYVCGGSLPFAESSLRRVIEVFGTMEGNRSTVSRGTTSSRLSASTGTSGRTWKAPDEARNSKMISREPFTLRFRSYQFDICMQQSVLHSTGRASAGVQRLPDRTYPSSVNIDVSAFLSRLLLGALPYRRLEAVKKVWQTKSRLSQRGSAEGIADEPPHGAVLRDWDLPFREFVAYYAAVSDGITSDEDFIVTLLEHSRADDTTAPILDKTERDWSTYVPGGPAVRASDAASGSPRSAVHRRTVDAAADSSVGPMAASLPRVTLTRGSESYGNAGKSKRQSYFYASKCELPFRDRWESCGTDPLEVGDSTRHLVSRALRAPSLGISSRDYDTSHMQRLPAPVPVLPRCSVPEVIFRTTIRDDFKQFDQREYEMADPIVTRK